MTPEEARVRVTSALNQLYAGGNSYGDGPSKPTAEQVAIHTEDFTDETCALIHSALGTAYEKPVLYLAHCGFDDQLMAAFVRFVPDLNEDEQYALNNYFRQLYRWRDRLIEHFDYSAAHFDALITSATDYISLTGEHDLPASAEDERELIGFAMNHPNMRDAILERFDENWIISPEVVKQLLASAPALTDGVL